MTNKIFVGFLPCVVCKEDTRHYTHIQNTRFVVYRRIWCEICKVLKMQFKNDIKEEGT